MHLHPNINIKADNVEIDVGSCGFRKGNELNWLDIRTIREPLFRQ
jgi:hypothetical protein